MTEEVRLGRKANRVEDSRVLGPRAVGGPATIRVEPDPFKGRATEGASELGLNGGRNSTETAAFGPTHRRSTNA